MPTETFKRNLKALEESHPLLSLQFQGGGGEKACIFEKPIASPDFGDADLLYVYGWESSSYPSLKSWLGSKKNRRLILLEDDLPTCLHFLEQEEALRLIDDPQIQLKFVESYAAEALKPLVWDHLYTPAQFFALPSKDLARQRHARELHALLIEIQMGAEQAVCHYKDYGKAHMKNVFSNLLSSRWVRSSEGLENKLQGIPAIICGAGPSLADSLESLKLLTDRALIFGGGSALAPLIQSGVLPHFGVSLDPDPPPERFLRQCGFEVPFFYQNQLSHALYQQIHGEKVCFGFSEGFPLEKWMTETLGLELSPFEPGWNVATFATHIAHRLGCNPIIFVGMDGCVLDDQIYVDGVEQPDEGREYKRVDTIPCQDRFGNQAFSRPDFLLGKKWLEDFAVSCPETVFINATEKGLSFQGITDLPLSTVSKRYLSVSRDLSSLIHHIMCLTKSAPIDAEGVREQIRKVWGSSQRCSELCSELLTLYERDFQNETYVSSYYALQEVELDEEIFYQMLLLPIWDVWKHVLQGKKTCAQMENPEFEQRIQRALFFKEVSKHYRDLTAEFL